MRRNLHETDEFVAAKRSSAEPARCERSPDIRARSCSSWGSPWVAPPRSTPTDLHAEFLRLSVGLNDIQTTTVTAASLIFALCLQPIYGALSDRIGRKALLIWFGVMGTLFTPDSAPRRAGGGESGFVAFLLIAGAWLIVAGYTSINAVVKAELFPTSRAGDRSGLPYAVTVSMFGGTAESIALWFQSIGHQRWFYYYLTAVIATSLIVYVTMRDTEARLRHGAPRVAFQGSMRAGVSSGDSTSGFSSPSLRAASSGSSRLTPRSAQAGCRRFHQPREDADRADRFPDGRARHRRRRRPQEGRPCGREEPRVLRSRSRRSR